MAAAGTWQRRQHPFGSSVSRVAGHQGAFVLLDAQLYRTLRQKESQMPNKNADLINSLDRTLRIIRDLDRAGGVEVLQPKKLRSEMRQLGLQLAELYKD